MDKISLFIWIVAFVIFILRFIGGPKYYTTCFLSLLLVYSVIILIKHSLFVKQQVSYILEPVPLSIQLLIYTLFFIEINNVIDKKNIEDFFSGLWFPVFIAIMGIGYILGASIFGYHFIQYITGITLFAVLICFIVVNRYSSYWVLQIVTVIHVLLIAFYYLITVYILYGEFSFECIRNMILNYSMFILYLLFFIALNLKRKDIYSEKKFKVITKIAFSLMLGSFLVVHPEIEFKQLPIINDALKYIVVTGDFGLLSYCCTSLVKGSKYLLS